MAPATKKIAAKKGGVGLKKPEEPKTKFVAVVIESSHRILFFKHKHYLVNVLEVPGTMTDFTKPSQEAVDLANKVSKHFNSRLLVSEEVHPIKID